MKLEEKFEQINDIMSKLEDNNISLDESYKIYTKGMKLIKECSDNLDKMEKEIMVIKESMQDENME
ncbi:MAG: exodeoxyribonuclease VII small subunit [Lachnospiraceae bacterium]|nr:exodeoxyribonuclease VII small subunit [Lachnospiraceae bacterium]